MSTRSIIVVKMAEGTYGTIYVHSDGYPSGVGATLIERYNDQAVVDELIGLGDLSMLGNTPAECVAYGRDRGETSTEAEITYSLERALRVDMGQEFEYLRDVAGVWLFRAAGATSWRVLDDEAVRE